MLDRSLDTKGLFTGMGAPGNGRRQIFYRKSFAITRSHFQTLLLQWHLAVKAKAYIEVCTIQRKCPEQPGAAAAITAAAEAVEVNI
jgi:hypothetical protein